MKEEYRQFTIETCKARRRYFARYRGSSSVWAYTRLHDTEEEAVQFARDRIDEFWSSMEALKARGAGV